MSMTYVFPLLIGFFATYIGFMAPSMLNMTATKITIENNKKAGYQFAIGATLIVFVQAFISLHCVRYLLAHEQLIMKLKIITVVVLFVLAVVYYLKTRKKFKVKENKKQTNHIVNGMSLSVLNMFAIPFYLATATYAESQGWIEISINASITYGIGAILGAFLLLTTYVIYSKVISEKVQYIATHINYILSILFALLAIFLSIQLFN